MSKRLKRLVAAAAACACGPAIAADLGGECCADLEERVAELEATAARKGNRQVSLTVSGYVAQELTVWDDGEESNAYLHGLGPTQASNFKFTGEAKIAAGLSAGYVMRIQNLTDDPFGRNGAGQAMNQASDDFSQGLNAQMSYWYVQDKDLGKLSIGRMANAAKSAAMFTDQSGAQLFDNYTFLDGFPQFVIRGGGDLSPPALTWGQLAFCYSQALPLGGDCNGLVMEAVRYDTPVFAGFSASASWGEDDSWEVAGRYAGEWSGLKLALGAGYSENLDENTSGPSVSPVKDSSFFQAGVYIQHPRSGLFANAAYGNEDNKDTLLSNGEIARDGEHWYAKAGIRQKWTPFGATIVYGDYGEYDDQLGPAALLLGASSSTLRRYGGGVAQEINAAATTVYVKAQRYDADVDGASLGELENLDLVSFGAVVSF